jgi:hypothetical protein
VVDSAGCGAAMKDYGRLVGTPEAAAFSERVRDFSEWVALQRPLALRETGRAVVVQDPCHLRHVQHAQGPVRAVLGPAYGLCETDDDGLCCGAGGAYSVTEPELSGQVRARKVETIRAAAGPGPFVVARRTRVRDAPRRRGTHRPPSRRLIEEARTASRNWSSSARSRNSCDLGTPPARSGQGQRSGESGREEAPVRPARDREGDPRPRHH